MAIERRLTEIVGPVGGKLHTARSRNDQVATDMAMFTRAHALADARAAAAPAERARAARRAPRGLGDARLHAPAARPARLPLAPPARLLLDVPARRAAASSSCSARPSELPLGAGALAGVNFATDRGLVARELGFAGVAPNSIDAVSNRDFVLDFLAAAATCATHLSRLGAEIVLWSSRGVRLLRRCRTPGRRAPRSCRRRRTRTRPSCCAPRRRASPRAWSRCTACCTACR